MRRRSVGRRAGSSGSAWPSSPTAAPTASPAASSDASRSRALAPAPRLLLADEPTAHLDRLTGRVVIKLLRQAVADNGTTIVAASHDPDVIAAADERLVLSNVTRSLPAELNTEPASEP